MSSSSSELPNEPVGVLESNQFFSKELDEFFLEVRSRLLEVEFHQNVSDERNYVQDIYFNEKIEKIAKVVALDNIQSDTLKEWRSFMSTPKHGVIYNKAGFCKIVEIFKLKYLKLIELENVKLMYICKFLVFDFYGNSNLSHDEMMKSFLLFKNEFTYSYDPDDFPDFESILIFITNLRNIVADKMSVEMLKMRADKDDINSIRYKFFDLYCDKFEDCRFSTEHLKQMIFCWGIVRNHLKNGGDGLVILTAEQKETLLKYGIIKEVSDDTVNE